MSRFRTELMLICGALLLLAGCVTRSPVRSSAGSSNSYQAIKPSLLSDHIRGLYKVSSEAGRLAEQRAALLASAPDLAPLLERAENDPADEEARSRIVSEYLSRDLHWGAYELLTNTLADNGNDPEVNLNLAVIWDAWGQYSLAWQYGERAVANGAASARAFETLGRIRLHQSNPAAAIEWYSRALEYGRSASILANMGYAQLRLSEWEKARVSLEEAVALDDTLEEVHNNLAVVLSKTGDDEGALAHLMKAGRPSAAFNNMGVLYLQEKRTTSAQHYFQEALRVDPAYKIAQRNLDALENLLPPPSILHLPAIASEPGTPAAATALLDEKTETPGSGATAQSSEGTSEGSQRFQHVLPSIVTLSEGSSNTTIAAVTELSSPDAVDSIKNPGLNSSTQVNQAIPQPAQQRAPIQGFRLSLGVASLAGLVFLAGTKAAAFLGSRP